MKDSRQDIRMEGRRRFWQDEIRRLTDMALLESEKTTLLNILAALDRPTGGQVLLGGKNLSGVKEKELEGTADEKRFLQETCGREHPEEQ